MKAAIEIEPAIEPMRTRVALHPFLAGMNRSQRRIAYRLRDGCSLRKRADNFPRRRNGQSILLDRNRKNSSRIERADSATQ